MADAWEPLFAIADLAGEDWGTRARAAAVELSAGGDGDEVGRGTRLLAAIHVAMSGRSAVATVDILEAINGDEEMPFGAWRDGCGLDGRGLARLLRPYGVNSEERRKIIIEQYKEITEAWAKGTLVAGVCFKGGPVSGVCEALFEPEPAE